MSHHSFLSGVYFLSTNYLLPIEHISMKNPTVSVVMPTYNASQFLGEAVDSILAQTFPDFEFIIVNDGSTDNTGEILESFQQKDSRIKVVTKENGGVATALNTGIELANGCYIARMDADDIALPNRFEEQVRFMDDNPQVGVCGTHAIIFGDHYEKDGIWESDTDNRRMQAWLFFGPIFCHPTVFLRRETLLRFGIKYNPEYMVGQDFKLWQELSQVTEFANLPKPLLRYRNHIKQVTARRMIEEEEEEYSQVALKTHYDQLKRLGIIPTKRELWIDEQLRKYVSTPDPSFLREAEEWILKIQAANNRLKIFPNPEFDFYLGRDWHSVCFKATAFGPKSYREYRKSPLFKIVDPSYHRDHHLRFLAKAMLRR
jgi:glycosyltransferase involved in cell wall biosynthesis